MLHYPSIATICLLAVLCSCSTYLPENEEKKENETENLSEHALRFSVKNNDNQELIYPIPIYVFDKENTYICQTDISSNADECAIELPENKYSITAFSGTDGNDYQFPPETTWTELIKMQEKNYASMPLQRAYSSINLNKPMSVNFTFLHATAAIYFTFSGVPAQCTGVEVLISPVSSGFSLNGEYNNDKEIATIPCHKTGNGTWDVGPVYIFPCQNSATNLSVNIQTNNKNEVYNYTYQAEIHAGYPYHFSGKYGQFVGMDGKFQIEGWEPAIEIEFDLNENSSEDNNPDDEDKNDEIPEETDNEVIFITEMPEADTIWGPFYVWEAQETDRGYTDVILIAPDQYYTLASDATLILEEYERDDFKNWRTFTKEEAERFRNQFFGAEELENLNSFITNYGLDRFFLEDGRYLCNELQSTFCFTNKRITAAGKKTEYYLRPIKTVRLKLK